jgi:hypothetical protein
MFEEVVQNVFLDDHGMGFIVTRDPFGLAAMPFEALQPCRIVSRVTIHWWIWQIKITFVKFHDFDHVLCHHGASIALQDKPLPGKDAP